MSTYCSPYLLWSSILKGTRANSEGSQKPLSPEPEPEPDTSISLPSLLLWEDLPEIFLLGIGICELWCGPAAKFSTKEEFTELNHTRLILYMVCVGIISEDKALTIFITISK